MRAVVCFIVLFFAARVEAAGWGQQFKSATVIRTSAPQVPIASLSFRRPGCYPSGSALGDRGEAVSVSRASPKVCPIAAGEQTCAPNEACVTEKGILIEPARTQLYPTPAAPAAGTITFPSTGTHQFWVKGTGSQQLSASGTLVATGLPCTATEASPCTFSVSIRGATPTGTLSAVNGVLTRGQVELGAWRHSFISSPGLDPMDVVTLTNPLTADNAADWCIGARMAPETNRAWNADFGQWWSMGTLNAPNTAYLMIGVIPQARGYLFDSAGGLRVVMDSSSVSGWTLGSTHHGAIGSNFGRLVFVADGKPGSSSVTGGTGLLTSPDPVFYVGQASGGAGPAGGYIQDLVIWKGTCR